MVSEKELFDMGLWDVKTSEINLSYTLDDTVYEKDLNIYLMTNPKEESSPVSIVGKYGDDVVVFYRFPHTRYVAAASLFKLMVYATANPKCLYDFRITLSEDTKFNKIVEGGRTCRTVDDIAKQIFARRAEQAAKKEAEFEPKWAVPCKSCRDCKHPMKESCVFYHGA